MLCSLKVFGRFLHSAALLTYRWPHSSPISLIFCDPSLFHCSMSLVQQPCCTADSQGCWWPSPITFLPSLMSSVWGLPCYWPKCLCPTYKGASHPPQADNDPQTGSHTKMEYSLSLSSFFHPKRTPCQQLAFLSFFLLWLKGLEITFLNIRTERFM